MFAVAKYCKAVLSKSINKLIQLCICAANHNYRASCLGCPTALRLEGHLDQKDLKMRHVVRNFNKKICNRHVCILTNP